MIRRLLLAIFIALVSGAWFGGHGGGGSNAPTDSLATLIANTINICGHGCWVRLSAPNSGPSMALAAFSPWNGGYSAAQFDIVSGNPWPVPGIANVGGGNDASLFSYSAPAIRATDGKICAVGTGGHFATGVSAVYCFNTIAAADNINHGGSGGVWSLAVKPARMRQCSDPRPSWQPQGACDNSSAHGMVGWTETNPNGQQMPISCHEYWSNKWIPHTHLLIWSGYYCGYNGGNTIGGAGYYDDDAPIGSDLGTVHFPIIRDPTYFGWVVSPVSIPGLGANAFGPLDGCFYYESTDGYHDLLVGKWCGLPSNPVNSGAFGTGIDGAGSDSTAAIMVPDPTNPTTLMWYAHFNMGYPGLNLFRGVGGTTTYMRLIFTTPWPPAGWSQSNNGAMGLCYDPAPNAILGSPGTSHIYKLGDRNNNGMVTNDMTNWGFVELTNNPGGIVPGQSGDSGSPWSCQSLEPNYPAILIAGVDQATSKMEVDLYVK